MHWEKGNQWVKEARTKVREKEVGYFMVSATITVRKGTQLSSVQRKVRVKVKAKMG